MKHLIYVLVLMVSLGCEHHSSESLNNTNATLSGDVAAEKKLSYLDEPIKGMISQRGLYRLVRSGGVVESAGTSTGKAVSKPVIQLVKSADRIPLIKRARIYLQYRLWYLPEQPAYVELRRVLKHPEMTLPDGSVSTGSEFSVKRKVTSNQVISYTGYGFDEDYELVEGDWVFEIWYQDKKLIEQTFTTYWPDEVEIAELTPILKLGNKVLGQVEITQGAAPGSGWPKVTVGGGEASTPAGVADVQEQMADPLVISDEKQQ